MAFVVGGQEHTPGDRKCCECWAGYPRTCKCKGLIHCQFMRENWEGELHFLFSCDNCGEDYKELAKTVPHKSMRRKRKWKRTK